MTQADPATYFRLWSSASSGVQLANQFQPLKRTSKLAKKSYTMAPSLLPPDFLAGPAPNLQKRNIDFKETDLPEYDGLYATVLDGVFTKEECHSLVKAAEATTEGGWEQAMVNIGNGEQMLHTDVRDCGRIIWDDREVVAKIWARCKDHMREIESLYNQPKITGHGPFKRKETWKLTRPNERMRFLKYGKGQYFRRESILLPTKSLEDG